MHHTCLWLEGVRRSLPPPLSLYGSSSWWAHPTPSLLSLTIIDASSMLSCAFLLPFYVFLPPRYATKASKQVT